MSASMFTFSKASRPGAHGSVHTPNDSDTRHDNRTPVQKLIVVPATYWTTGSSQTFLSCQNCFDGIGTWRYFFDGTAS